MSWMANAMFGRCNTSMLCWHGETTEAILEFLRRVLPSVIIDDRIRCLKKYAARTIVFWELVPRTQRQRQKIYDLARTRNIIFVNPNRTAINHRLRDIYEILDGIQPELLESSEDFVCLVRKFYLVTHASCLQVHAFFRDLGPRTESSQAVFKKFLEYREHAWPLQRSMGFHEFLANASLVDFSDAPESHPGESWMAWFSRSYMNSTGFLLWLIRVYSGLVLPNTIMVVEDSTNTTVDLLRQALKHLRVGYVSSAEDSFLLVEYASYDLVIFDHFNPLLDLVTVASRTNVLVIGSYMTVRAQTVRSEFVGQPPLNQNIPHAYFTMAYDVVVKEPTFIVFVRHCLDNGTYTLNKPMNIEKMLRECKDWCQHHGIPWKITDSIAMHVQEITASLALRSYFRCACVGSTIVLCGSKRLGLGI